MKKQTIFLVLLILVFVEQFIKHIIRTNYMEAEFPILPPLFYFLPKVNTNYSYVNDLFDLGLGWGFHIGLQLIGLIALSVCLAFYRFIIPTQKVMQSGLLIALSGVICVFVDTLFFGGSLDYIYLKPLYIFDLKDVYLNAGAILVILSFFTMNKEDKELLYNAKWADFIQMVLKKK